MKNEIKNILIIIIKDLKAYYFKPATISWGILFPIVFVLIFALKNGGDISSLIGGLFSMSIFFGATSMTATSIMMERKINVFNIYYSLPISYYGIVIAKIMSGAFFGIFTACMMFFVAVLIVPLHIYNIPLLVLWLVASSVAFSGVGVYIALLVKEAYDAMTYMNLIRLPLLFVSGIFLSINSLPKMVKIFSYMSPLTYSVDISNQIFFNQSLINLKLSVCILILLSVVFVILSRNKINALRG